MPFPSTGGVEPLRLLRGGGDRLSESDRALRAGRFLVRVRERDEEDDESDSESESESEEPEDDEPEEDDEDEDDENDLGGSHVETSQQRYVSMLVPAFSRERLSGTTQSSKSDGSNGRDVTDPSLSALVFTFSASSRSFRFVSIILAASPVLLCNEWR